MNWTEFTLKEKEKIYDIVAKNHSEENTLQIFGLDVGKKSYFTEYNRDFDIVEQDFETLSELRELLRNMWEKDGQSFDEMTLTCAIAAFKGRDFLLESTKKNVYQNEDGEMDYKLPDCIYTF